jgi:hypothetical protein
MANVLGHSYGYLLIICKDAEDLKALSSKAGLKVATECRCGKCALASGQHGFVDGGKLLDEVATAHSDHDYRQRYYGQGLYLVSQFGHASVSDSNMLGAVCTPVHRRGSWEFHCGLNFRDGAGRDIPWVAHHLANVAQQQG